MIKNSVLAVVSIVLTLLLGELVLRQFVILDSGMSKMYRIPDPVLGWRLEPNVSYRNVLPERVVSVSYNSQGWRDDDHSVATIPEKFRIAVLGDSFMEGYSVAFSASFPRRVKHFMEEQGVEVEVVNLGVGGYGTLQEYIAFDEHGRYYRPNLVLLAFYIANDIENNSIELSVGPRQTHVKDLKRSARPFLDPENPSEWKVTQIDYEHILQKYERVKAHNNTLLPALARKSAVFHLLREGGHGLKHLFEEDRNSFAETHAGYGRIAGHDERKTVCKNVHCCDEAPEVTRSWILTERILQRLKNDVEEAGGRLVVFSVPALEEVDVKHDEGLCLEQQLPGYEHLKRSLERLDIDYVDLLPSFRREAHGDITRLFWKSDKHWNPDGHALAARIVVSNLFEKNLIRRTSSRSVQTGPLTVHDAAVSDEPRED